MEDQTHITSVDNEAAFSRLMLLDTDSVSPEMAARSRKNTAIFLQFIKNATAATIAERMGIHESTMSRFQNGPLGVACLALACAGLKIVPEDAIVYLQPDEFK